MAAEFVPRNGQGKVSPWMSVIRLMHREGKSLSAIAKVVGADLKSICRVLKKDRGECQFCPNLAERTKTGKVKARCAECATKQRVRNFESFRRPSGWADKRAARHRERAKDYNKRFEAITGITQQTNITGPELLDRVYKCGSACALCGKDEGWPWDNVGKKSGPDVDHILGIGSIIEEGRDDWCRPKNIRLLCKGCHSSEGERRSVDEEILTLCIERALAKDRT